MNDIDLERGYKLVLENAKQLFNDAKLLNENERHSRAYTLFQLAIEEVGKCFIIWLAILEYYNGVTINEAYLKGKGFLSHEEKTKQSLNIELFAVKIFALVSVE